MVIRQTPRLRNLGVRQQFWESGCPDAHLFYTLDLTVCNIEQLSRMHKASQQLFVKLRNLFFHVMWSSKISQNSPVLVLRYSKYIKVWNFFYIWLFWGTLKSQYLYRTISSILIRRFATEKSSKNEAYNKT